MNYASSRLCRPLFCMAAACSVAIGTSLAGPLAAQTPGTNGSVTGQVYCSDTQKPARFALVSLVPSVSNAAQDSGGGRRGGFGAGTNATTADGTFTIKDVPAGVYDVQVSMPGYIQPIRQLNLLADGDPVTRQPFLNMLTQVTIQAGQVASANVTAYRGADLAGTVSYDDGTPAAGLSVSAMVALAVAGTGIDTSLAAASANLRSIGSYVQSDDRGRFLLSGLADGTYTVQATPRGGGGLFPVFLGNTFDRTRATMVTVKAGEEKTGMDLQIDIANLHRVRGVLTSPDSHPLPNSSITLSLAGNSTAQLHATTAADGSFSFTCVPDGKFTVMSSGAYDLDNHVTYKAATTQITVAGTDVSDVVLTPAQ